MYLFGSYLAGASAGVDEAMGLGAWPIDGPGLADAGAFFAAGLAGGVVFAMRMSPELFASRSRRLIHEAKSTGAPAERGGSTLKASSEVRDSRIARGVSRVGGGRAPAEVDFSDSYSSSSCRSSRGSISTAAAAALGPMASRCGRAANSKKLFYRFQQITGK